MRDCAAVETASSAARPELLWAEAPAELGLRPAETHVLALDLDRVTDLASARSLLSREEKARAARCYNDLHRNRFIAGRSFLRTVLGKYLGIKPGSILFTYGPNGKPELGAIAAESGLRFNLAHSENLALLALTTRAEVGTDIERVRPVPEAAELVRRFFSSRETAQFGELLPEQQSPAFFNLWTRKEALLKATGEGIAHSLRSVEVSFLPYEPARLLSVPPGIPAPGHWTLRELHPAPGFIAALVVASFPIHLRTFSWPPELNQ